MEQARNSRPAKARLSSVANSIRLLSSFSGQENELGITVLASRLKLAKSTVHRLAATLTAARFLEQNGETGKYRLGLALFELGSLVRARMDVADASSIKVFGTEFYLESFRLLMEIAGERAYLQRGSAGDWLAGQIEMLYRSLLILTFGGGTNEVQRELIGLFGLGLPRIPRM